MIRSLSTTVTGCSEGEPTCSLTLGVVIPTPTATFDAEAMLAMPITQTALPITALIRFFFTFFSFHFGELKAYNESTKKTGMPNN